MKKYLLEKITAIIESISSLEAEDWYRLGLFFGISLIIIAKPISFFSEIASIIIYVIGVLFFFLPIYLSYRSL